MRHSVWIILENGSVIKGWISTAHVEMALRGGRLRAGDTFRMAMSEKYGIQEDTPLEVADILVEWKGPYIFCRN